MEAKIQQQGTPASLPRVDVSVLGPVGEQVEASRDRADKIGVTADIEKMAFTGMTTHQIAGALKDRLEAVQAEGDPRNTPREQAYFVGRVRMSLGVPPSDDEAGFKAWQAQVAGRMENAEAVATEAVKPAPEKIVVDQATQDKLAGLGARDMAQAQAILGLNSIEPDLERKRQKLDGDEETKRAAWLKQADDETTKPRPPGKSASGNTLESDEIFTASQADIKPLIPQDIEKQYLRVGGKFYHPKNTDLVAFEDKGNKLETRSNSEHIAESMVRIAEARGWDEIKVSGSEVFRREVWLEAASRGMQVNGYTPSEQDKAQLAKRIDERQANKLERDGRDFRLSENKTDEDRTVPQRQAADSDAQMQAPAKPETQANGDKGRAVNEEKRPASVHGQMAESFAKEPPAEAVRKYPELAGAYATVAALDKKAEADGLDERQRALVAAKVRELVTDSIEQGNIPNTKLREEREMVRARSNEREYSR